MFMLHWYWNKCIVSVLQQVMTYECRLEVVDLAVENIFCVTRSCSKEANDSQITPHDRFHLPRPPTGTSWEVAWRLHNFRFNFSSRFIRANMLWTMCVKSRWKQNVTYLLCSTFNNLLPPASWVPRSPNRLHTLTSSLELAGRRPRSLLIMLFVGFVLKKQVFCCWNKLLMSVPMSLCLSLPRVCPCIISGFDGLQALGRNWSDKKPQELAQTWQGAKNLSTYGWFNPPTVH